MGDRGRGSGNRAAMAEWQEVVMAPEMNDEQWKSIDGWIFLGWTINAVNPDRAYLDSPGTHKHTSW